MPDDVANPRIAEWCARGVSRGMKPYDEQADTDELAARMAAGYVPRYGGLTGDRIAGAMQAEYRRSPRLRRAVVLYRVRTHRQRHVRLIARGRTSRAPRSRRSSSRSRARAPGRSTGADDGEPEPLDRRVHRGAR